MNTQLKPTLGTLHLWGIAVGLVISGEYFGWSYGWGVAGTLGFLVTSFMVATMYTCFIFSFTELTTAIPHAGGPFAYSRRAFGEKGGLIAGLATLIEFVFAPPAIALAIGAYLNVQFPALDPKHAAVGAYIGAAYWFTSSTSFANPAVTIGRIFTDTFAGIAPASAWPFLAAQLVGAALGVGLVLLLFPLPRKARS